MKVYRLELHLIEDNSIHIRGTFTDRAEALKVFEREKEAWKGPNVKGVFLVEVEE